MTERMESMAGCDRCGNDAFRLVLKISGYTRTHDKLTQHYSIDYAECTRCDTRMMFGAPASDKAEIAKATREREETGKPLS